MINAARTPLCAGMALLVLTCCFGAVSQASASSAQPPSKATPCSVGRVPEAVEFDGVTLFKPPHSARVIACGTSFVGSFEIAVYPSAKYGVCTLVVSQQVIDLSGDGSCGSPSALQPPPNKGEIRVSRTGWTGRSKTSYSYLTGGLGPDVARVVVRYHRKNKKPISRAGGTVAQVNGELLSSFHQAVPFGMFVVVLPGCVVPHGLRVVAFDSEGNIVGSQRGQNFPFGNPCHSRDPSDVTRVYSK